MSGDCRNTQLNQNRSAGRSHNAVVRRGGNAHAQNDAAQHGQDQADDNRVARNSNNAIDHGGSKTRYGNAAGNQTGHGACNSNGDNTLSARLQRFVQHVARNNSGLLEHIADSLTLFALAKVGQEKVDAANQERTHNGNSCGNGHGARTRGHQPHQQNQRQNQIAVLRQIRPFGQLTYGNTFQAELLCLQVDRNENAGEVQKRRDQSLRCDFDVRNAHVLGHQERGSAHDRGHDLSAGR